MQWRHDENMKLIIRTLQHQTNTNQHQTLHTFELHSTLI
jgi:hypothetical protein